MFDFLNGMGEAAVEKMFLNLIKDFSVEDLKEAVKTNLSLLEQTATFNPRMLAMAERLAKRFQSQKDTLTPDNVMGWLKEKRNDFYLAVLFNNNNKRWLDTQISGFRAYLWDY